MKKLTKFLILFSLSIILSLSFFTGSSSKNVTAYSATSHITENKIKSNTSINDFQGVADYIHKYNQLPPNYITKAQAQKLGWRPGKDLWKYARGKSIGGDTFTNYQKVLPTAKGRIWKECDINYNGGHRGADRILFSNDGLVYGTSDHYETFTLYYGKN